MSTVLLTGGRAPATLHLARLFHAAGHRVCVAECLPHHLCQGSLAVARNLAVPAPNTDAEGFVRGLAEACSRERVDLLVPTCEEVFHVVRGAARLPCEVFAPRWERLARLHAKWDFIQDVSALGKPVPPTWLVSSDDALAALLAGHRMPGDAVTPALQGHGGPGWAAVAPGVDHPPGAASDWGAIPRGQRLVLKPVYSRFGTQVRVLTAGQDSPPRVGATPTRPWVLQAFIEGQPLCTFGVARAGRLQAHAAYATDFAAGNGASVRFRPLPDPDVERWVADLVEAWQLTGQVAFDLVRTPDGKLLPLECNPRATSGIHLFEAGDGLPEAILGTAAPLARPRPDAHAMLGLAMWVYALPTALARGPAQWESWRRAASEARDVVFRWNDPLPALGQGLVYADLLARGLLHGISAIEASTRDIEWNGECASS